MAKTPVRSALLAGFTFWLGSAAAAWANPQVVAVLKYAPVQPGVQVSTPGADEIPKCDLKVVAGPRGGSGYELKDPAGKLLRRFFDTNGDKKIDLFSYYKDGVEVYREIDTDADNRPDMFRWLNAGGMKWGQDINQDGKVDTWRMISAEEAGEEAFQALATGNFDRLKALFISDEDMKFLKLAPADVERLTKLQKDAAAKFAATRAKLPQLTGAKFERLESAVPNCAPGDAGEKDMLKFPTRLILYEIGAGKDSKHDWLDTGEMIQVGYAWRLTDVPEPHSITPPAASDVAKGGPELQKLYEDLNALDKDHPTLVPGTPKNDAVAKYNLQRVALLQKIQALETDARARESWTKQICDNLSTAYQAGHDGALTQLAALKDDFLKKDAAGNLAAYATYREMWGKYARQINEAEGKVEPMAKAQEEWLDKLSKFVTAFPRADDTTDALWQLAMGCEYAEKDEQAKRWYQQIYTTFPTNPLAEKAKGAERRLGLIGRELELKAKTVEGKDFDVVNTKGKVTVVYYWSSNVGVCARDFAILKTLVSTYEAKGLTIVTVNLDENQEAAAKFLAANPLTATHLGEFGKEGGMAGPLATYYGINSLPTLFLIGRDGRVVNRTVQAGDLEAALKKAL